MTNFEFGDIILVPFPFTTIEKPLVLKKLGSLQESDQIALQQSLRTILGEPAKRSDQ